MKRITLTIQLLILSFICFQSSAQTLSLTRRYGSTGADAGTAAYVHASGNSYIAGNFSNTVSFGATTLTASGVNNAYLIRNAFNGTVQYVKGFIGTGSATITDIVTDSNLDTYVTGYFSGSIDFDPSAATSILGSNLGTTDIFVAKLSAGGGLIWVKKAGGEGNDYGHSLALDNNGDVVIVGSADDNASNAIDFNPDAAVQNVSTVGRDGIIWRLDAFNGTYVGVGRYGTTNSDEVRKVKVDASGNVYVAGYFSIGGVTTLIGTGNLDGFIIKYSPTYTILWTRQFGGLQDQVVYDLDVDASGNVYSVGTYEGAGGNTSNFDYLTTLGGLAGLSNTVADGFLCKLNASGAFQWAKGIKGSGIDYPKNVSLNSAGDILVAGIFQGTSEFDPSTLTSSFTSNGGYDAFIAKYDANGNFTNNIQTFGEVGDDFLNGLATSGTSYYVTGSFNNTIDVSATTTPVNLTSSGLSDAFFLCYTVCSMPPTPTVNTVASSLSFCNNQSVLLQVNTLPANTTVRWFANNTTTSTLQATTSLSYTTPVLTASTNFYVSASNTCGESARNTVVVTKTALPTVTASSSPASICLGQTATLTGLGAITYTWAGGPTAPKYVVTPSITTTYTVTGSNSGIGCTDVGTYTLVVKSIPGVSITASRNNFCNNLPMTTNFTQFTASGANTYYWEHGGGQTTPIVSDNLPLGLSSYTVTGTTQGCSKTTIITMTVNGIPTVTSAVSKPAYCKSELTSATLSGASLYKFGNGVLGANRIFNASFTTPGTNATSYVAFSAANCSVSGTFNVSVVSPPVITGSVSTPNTCMGIASTITRSGGTITWPSGLTVLNATQASISPTTTTTSFVVTATGLPGCTSTDVLTITRIPNATPTLTLLASQTNICNGTNVTFTGMPANTNGASLITYSWYKNSSSFANNSASFATNVLANNDQFQLGITISNPVCLTSSSAFSNIITMTNSSVSPSVTISTPNTTICSADVTDFTANITNGGSNQIITWKIGNSSFNTNNTLFTAGNITNGQIVSCIISSTGTCLTSSTATSTGLAMTVRQSTVLVNSLPAMPSTTCGSVTYSLTATGLNNAFAWSNGFTNAGNTSSITVSATDSYSATVTGTCNAVASNVVSLTKYNPTQINSSLTNRTICGGDFTTFSVPISGDNLSFLWSNGETTPDINASIAGNYSLTATGSCGNNISNTANVVVNPLTSITSQTVSTTVSSGNFANFNIVALGNNLNYIWSSGETNSNISTSVAGIYTVTVSGTCGTLISNAMELTEIICNSSTTINTHPQSIAVCQGATANLSVNALGIALNYLWSNGETTNSTATTLVGNYLVTVSGACGTVVSNQAVITNKPPTQITTQPIASSTICGDNAINLSVVATGEAPLSYLWSSGETTAAVSKSTAGLYSVVVTGGCGTANSNITTLTSQVCTTTSINQPNYPSSKFTIAPNPYTNGELRIENGVGDLQIYNSLGAVVYSSVITSENTTLNLNLVKGIYLVKVGSQVSKLVVE